MISIFLSGNSERISLHFLCGFFTHSPFFITLYDTALKISSLVNTPLSATLLFAKTIPSYPIKYSIGSIPFFAHNSFSLDLIALDALVISGVVIPIPLQKIFIPPPEPVDSTTGVLNSAC